MMYNLDFYNIFDNTVTVVVVEVEGHYKDK